MGVRRRTAVLVGADLLVGVVGAWLMWREALPLYPNASPLDPVWQGVAAVLATGALAGLVVGLVQAWFAGWLELWSGLVGGLLLGMFPTWYLVSLVVQFNRWFPAQDGAPGLDPLPADLLQGELLWGGFVVGLLLVVAVVHPRLRVRRIAHLERAAAR